MASFFLAPLPYLAIAGGILGIVAGICLATGIRDHGACFPERIFALTVYVLGILITIPVAISYPIISNETDLQSAFNVSIGLYLLAVLAASAVTGASIVLFTYGFQDSQGRLLLWAGYGAAWATGVLTLILGTYQLNTILQQACVAGCHPPTTSSLLNLQGYIQFLRVLGFIPAAIYFTAYYRLHRSIVR